MRGIVILLICLLYGFVLFAQDDSTALIARNGSAELLAQKENAAHQAQSDSASKQAQIDMALKYIPRLSHISGHMGSTAFSPEIKEMAKRVASEYHLAMVDGIG